MSNLPADWAIEKALKEVGEVLVTAKEVREAAQHGCYRSAIVKLARYIEAHEKPPVDRKLRVAREAAARLVEWNEQYASAIRIGWHDKTCGRVVAGEMAIALWEEGFGEDPEATVPQCQ